MSIIPRKHQKNGKKLFLFDPITTERKLVDYDYLDGLLSIPSNQLSVYICKRKPLYQLGGFLCNEDFTRKDYIYLMSSWNTDEVKAEIWKNLSGGKTQVSSLGRFRTLQKDGSYNFIMPLPDSNGHLRIKVWVDGVYGFKNAQRIIADKFLFEHPKEKNCVAHKNDLQYDNRANNLEWLTKKEVSIKSGKLVSNKIYKVDIATGKIVDDYLNAAEAARENYVVRDTIKTALRGNGRTSVGHHWIRAKDCQNPLFL